MNNTQAETLIKLFHSCSTLLDSFSYLWLSLSFLVIGISALQMGQVFLTLAHCLRHIMWKTCFYEQGSTKILLPVLILIIQMEQSPPELTRSLVVASLEERSMNCPEESYPEQKQQKMMSPRHMRGDIAMKKQIRRKENCAMATKTI